MSQTLAQNVNTVYFKMIEKYANRLLDFGYCNDSDIIDLLTVKWMNKLFKNYSDIIEEKNIIPLNLVLNCIVNKCSLVNSDDLLE